MDLGLLVEDKVAVAGPRGTDASSSMMHSMEDGASGASCNHAFCNQHDINV